MSGREHRSLLIKESVVVNSLPKDCCAVVLLDDVYTTGNTFNGFCDLLDNDIKVLKVAIAKAEEL